ncbi:MAG: PAS domain-containing sensor histidine kinase [Euryarchaeota archaeon]|nr:PAS domain-containing sensor histidine kinase [Euryarchaeota archaeon]
MADSGAAATAEILAAERNIALIRASVVLVNSIIYVTLLDRDVGWPQVALGVIAVVNVYSIGVVVFEPYRRFDLLLTSWFITILDAGFITLWILATGGMDSPFYVLWYVSLAAISYRFSYQATVTAGVAYSGIYITMAAALGQFTGRIPEISVRVAYILFAAALGALLARESLAQAAARQRLEEKTVALERDVIERSTRLRTVEEAEAKFRGISETANDAIISADGAGRVIHFNQGAQRIFGYKAEAVIGQPLTVLMPEKYHEAFTAGFTRYLETGEARVIGKTMELTARQKNGNEIPVEISTAVWKSGDATFFTAIMRDVTERRRAEAERMANVAKLKELERLKEEDRFKTQFINMAAHELNTPLTPIKLQVHLLKAGKAGYLDSEQTKAVTILERNVDRLAQLVADVLQVARMQAGRLGVEKQAIDLNRLVLEAVESFQAGAKNGGVEIRAQLTPDLTVEADAKRVNQVLFNLLSNALKFTPTGGRVSVETTRDRAGAVVTVRDTGAGLRPEDMERLFKPFSQVQDPMQRTDAGTGLGLYISRSLVELHGGRMWCESTGPGFGSAFSFSLPIGPEAQKPQKPLEPVPEQRREGLAKRAKELI